MSKKYLKNSKNLNRIEDFDSEVLINDDVLEGVLFSTEDLEESLKSKPVELEQFQSQVDFTDKNTENVVVLPREESLIKSSKNKTSVAEPLINLEDLDKIKPSQAVIVHKTKTSKLARFKSFLKNLVKISVLAGFFWLVLTAQSQIVRVQYFLNNFNNSSSESADSDYVNRRSFVYAISTALAQNPYNSDALANELRTLKNKPAGLAENRLVIPKTKVSAPVVWNSASDEATVMKNLHDGVVHYGFTHTPNSESGNVFINGHSSYYPWDSGKYKTVFALLNKLKKGDRAYIQYEGKIFVYEMTKSVVVSPDKVEIAGDSDKPILSLMTCDPVGTFLNRLVVQFDLVGVYKT